MFKSEYITIDSCCWCCEEQLAVKYDYNFEGVYQPRPIPLLYVHAMNENELCCGGFPAKAAPESFEDASEEYIKAMNKILKDEK